MKRRDLGFTGLMRITLGNVSVMFIKTFLKSYVYMTNWEDVLALCPISVVPYVVLTGKVSEDAVNEYDRVIKAITCTC